MFSSSVIVYKLITGLVFGIFGWFISDVRNKNTKPLINQPWLSLMRFSYPLSPICFMFFLITTKQISSLDWLSVLLMLLGTFIVFSAKSSLGTNHSWTGYSAINVTEFNKTGIYKYLRHPLYLGIIVAVLGTTIFIFQRVSTSIFLFVIYLLGMIFTFAFIFISSKKETEYLIEKFGIDFLEYVEQTPSFFPNVKRLFSPK